jgi:hypothetical protein
VRKRWKKVPNTKPVVDLGELVLQALGATSTAMAAAAHHGHEKYSVPKWIPDLSLTPGSFLRPQLSCSIPADDVEFMADLGKVCHFFLPDALEQLGPDDVRRLVGHLKKYYSWTKQQIEIASNSSRLAQHDRDSERSVGGKEQPSKCCR